MIVRDLERRQKKVADCTVIIRGDAQARVGLIKQVIEQCQKKGFEIFKLRAKKEG
jgi:biopolymer transport protein ExbD